MDDFKIPQHVSQDLLLIHDLVADSLTSSLQKTATDPIDHSIDSSDDSDNASEDEIEANLMMNADEIDSIAPKSSAPSDSNSDSGSDSDSSSDDSDTDEKAPSIPKVEDLNIDDDDDEAGPAVTTGTYFQTKNEVVETDITIPDIEEVGPDEVLEKVGEVMTVMEKLAIVKGVASEIADRGSERALDSDTLLVFEDRKVMGYIYETFGPTTQPLYQVKFTQNYPLDPEKVRLDREVFHVPQRSHFVFLNQIRHLKGSDASNVHDEEPGDDELEFSDDEAEAAYKASLKRKRGESRANSVASSRFSTPTPSQMNDQDLSDSGFSAGNPYDAHGAYDMDFVAGSSRPAPIPYDDPYSDDFTGATLSSIETGQSSSVPQRDSLEQSSSSSLTTNERGNGRGRGRGRGRGQDRADARQGWESGGRGRGRGRGRGDRGDRGRARGGNARPRNNGDEGDSGWAPRPADQRESVDRYDPRIPRPLSPTSLAIARATGQYMDGTNFASAVSSPSIPAAGIWSNYNPPQQNQPQHQFSFGPEAYQQNYIQPHINPRFASAFGMNMGYAQPQRYPQYGQYGQDLIPNQTASSWTDEWTVHGADHGSSADNNSTAPGSEHSALP